MSTNYRSPPKVPGPDRTPGLSSISPGLSSRDGGSVPTIANYSWNRNDVHGTGNTVNNHNYSSTYVVYEAAPNNPNNLQERIATALEPRHVPEAVYDAQPNLGCMPGTRVQVLTSVDSWIKNRKAPQIFWLTGHAGSGKSAIGHTVCTRACEDPEIILGGSFFCSRSAGSVAQRDARCIIPTLAQLLARQSPEFSQTLANELARDPDVLHKQITIQVERLLQKPLLALQNSRLQVLFVIDALDECASDLTSHGTMDDPNSYHIVSDMLESLVAFSRSAERLPVKFMIISRPETHIRDTPVSDVAFSRVLQLHTVDKEQVTEDILLYINTRLSRIPKLRRWFTTDDAERLARLSGGLFIVATTALHYAFAAGIDSAPVRLQALLNVTRDGLSTPATAPLDRMYALILSDATADNMVEEHSLPTMLRVLGSLLAARMTLSVVALADLLGMSRDQLRASLSRLHAVIHVPENDIDPGLRTLHASFGDYLLERADDRYRIERQLGDTALADGCLQVMAEQLHFNVSRSRSSHESNNRQRPENITLALEYACLHWIYHVSRLPEHSPSPSDGDDGRGLGRKLLSLVLRTSPSPLASKIDETISVVFRPRLLFWLEVMSLLGHVRRSVAILNFAVTLTRCTNLSRFLRDANAFVASSQEAIERSAPHIYLSALPLAAKDSLVYQDFAPFCTGLVQIGVFGVNHHAGQLVMSLTGHTDSVNSIAYSPDGGLLVSGSNDCTVRIWDMRTSEEAMPPLRSDDGSVASVAFAPSGMNVASGTLNGVVCLWGIFNGQVAPSRLLGHAGAVLSVAFSSDGSRLASGSTDNTVRIWTLETPRRVNVLCGHTSHVNSVAYSTDGDILVSGSDDRTIRTWHGVTCQPMSHVSAHPDAIRAICLSSDSEDMAIACGRTVTLAKFTTGKKIRTLQSGPQDIKSLGFSPDGQSLVSAHDKSVRLSILPRFGGKASPIILGTHMDRVTSVTFSPNGLHTASASADCAISVWNAEKGKVVVQSLPGHTDCIRSLVVFPDGSHIVSGSFDRSIRVWNLQTGALTLPPLLGHTGGVFCVAITQDGRFIASASTDQSVRLWNARTGEPVGKPMRTHKQFRHSVTFSPDGRWLASGLGINGVRLWDVATQRPSALAPFYCHGYLCATAFSPDGQLLAAGDSEGCIYLWQVPAGSSARAPLHAGPGNANDVVFSPNRAHIASMGLHAVYIWDMNEGHNLFYVRRQNQLVHSIAYSPSGQLIGCCWNDRTVRLLDATSGTELMILNTDTGTDQRITSLVFTPNERFVIAGSWDGTISAWRIDAAMSVPLEHGSDPRVALSSATLDGGWLVGPSAELLVWIPASYRALLPVLPCTLQIKPETVMMSVGDNGWHHGESWTACWRDSPTPTFS